VPAIPSPAVPSAEQVAQALAEAPVLAPDAARALLEDAARRGEAPGHALDVALYVASAGFADIDRATLDELSGLFAKSWRTRSAADQGRIQAYLRYARAGEPLSPEAAAKGRALFGEGVRSLPPAAQARLTALFGTAVTAGITHRQRAEERTRVAVLNPPPLAEAPAPTAETSLQARAHASRWPAAEAGSGDGTLTAVTAESAGQDASEPGLTRSTGRGESYWRSRAASARSAVEAAEKNVRRLEEQASRGGPAVAGPLPAACQAGVVTAYRGQSTVGGRGAIELRDASRNSVHCDSEVQSQQAARNAQSQLEAARASLKRAQKALDDLDDEARQAGALPGWLR
jgi:hypothetical protein